jgi:hypothetical protein
MPSLQKPARILGVSSALGCLILWGYLVYSQIFNPIYGADDTVRTAAVMGVLALGGIVATLFDRPFLMIVIFLFSFFPIGVYMLGLPSIYRLIGVFDMLYLLAAVILLYYRFQARYKR